MSTPKLEMLNTQPAEKPDYLSGLDLDIHSVFYTIQGEGPFVGSSCVFVRMAGCNLQCPSCDTLYTTGRKRMGLRSIISEIKRLFRENQKAAEWTQLIPNLVVITGGEPFRQNIGTFVEELLQHSYHVQIETNGTLFLPQNHYDREAEVYGHEHVTIVCSPKAPEVNKLLKSYVNSLKYILEHGKVDPTDGLPTSHLDNNLRPCRPWNSEMQIFVNPMDAGNKTAEQIYGTLLNHQAAKESAMRYGYTLGCQMHKIYGLD